MGKGLSNIDVSARSLSVVHHANLVTERNQVKEAEPTAAPDKLAEVVNALFEGERRYTAAEAMELMQTRLNITPLRAINGLIMMVEAELLDTVDGGDHLFRADSTPF